MAFRRPDSPFLAAAFRLEGLAAEAEYACEDRDSGRRWRQTGGELMRSGLQLEMPEAPGSRLVFYDRVG
jgi:hypothetical protein